MPVVIDGTNTSTFPAVDGTAMLQGSVAMPRMVLATAQNATSGTAIDFTGIPSWVKRITVMFNGVSLSGTSNFLIQLGSGSVTSSGYTSGCNNGSGTVTTSTAGFLVTVSAAAVDITSGMISLTTPGSNVWTQSAMLNNGSSIRISAGIVTLSGTLDRLRLTTVSGADTFDAGSVNILYEG